MLLLIYYMTEKITNLTLKINDTLAAISQSERRNIINCFLFVSVVSDEIFQERSYIQRKDGSTQSHNGWRSHWQLF